MALSSNRSGAAASWHLAACCDSEAAAEGVQGAAI